MYYYCRFPSTNARHNKFASKKTNFGAISFKCFHIRKNLPVLNFRTLVNLYFRHFNF